jgi:hypothetical protein
MLAGVQEQPTHVAVYFEKAAPFLFSMSSSMKLEI